ncbi:MAG: TonB family protein [Verrucomicrobiota bacterium]
MRIRYPKTPFSISLTLHLSLLLVVLVGGLFQGCSEPEDAFVFEMVSLPDFASNPSTLPPPISTQQPILERKPEPLPEPSFSRLEPARERPIIEQSVPPIADPPPIVERSKKPKPEPEPEKPRQRMTLEEYRKLHGEPKQTPSRPTPARPTARIELPSINADEIVQSLENAAGQVSPSRSTSTNVDATHGKRVRSFLNSLWKEPDLPAQNLTLTVRFWYDGSGKITDYRIIKRSGLQEFDQAVEQFFAGLSSIPAPSNRRSGQYDIPFSIR